MRAVYIATGRLQCVLRAVYIATGRLQCVLRAVYIATGRLQCVLRAVYIATGRLQCVLRAVYKLIDISAIYMYMCHQVSAFHCTACTADANDFRNYHSCCDSEAGQLAGSH